MSRQKRKVTIISGDGNPLQSNKQDRNTPCSCGSGIKAKKCCGAEASYFYKTKKTPDNQDRVAQNENITEE